jgi:biofilm PGA synthesis N-glycosyltransferase PgaC
MCIRSPRYVVISAVCNETSNIAALIDSVRTQTILPEKWIIVNDGSSDGTLEILEDKCSELPWVQIVSRPNKGYVGLSGGEVLSAITEGLLLLRGFDYEYIAKVDGDSILEPIYFESLIEQCERDPLLGIASGSCWESRFGQHYVLRTIPGSAWPPARLYRRSCFEGVSVGNPVLGWDMLHVLRARSAGWRVKAFSAPRFLHTRRMGSRGGVVRGKFRYGRTSYLLGYSRIYFALRLLYQMWCYPQIVGSIAMALGYLRSVIQREGPVVNEREKAEMRRMQKECLLRPVTNSNTTAGGYVRR